MNLFCLESFYWKFPYLNQSLQWSTLTWNKSYLQTDCRASTRCSTSNKSTMNRFLGAGTCSLAHFVMCCRWAYWQVENKYHFRRCDLYSFLPPMSSHSVRSLHVLKQMSGCRRTSVPVERWLASWKSHHFPTVPWCQTDQTEAHAVHAQHPMPVWHPKLEQEKIHQTQQTGGEGPVASFTPSRWCPNYWEKWTPCSVRGGLGQTHVPSGT